MATHAFKELIKLGAGDFQHISGTLITHLKETKNLLQKWGARDVLCDAGLYHAAYGTDAFEQNLVPLVLRSNICKIIGEEAEALVYLYCSCDRSYVFPKLGSSNALGFRDRFTGAEFVLEPQQARDFCELSAANEMQLLQSDADFRTAHGEDLFGLFEQMKSFLSKPAIVACAHESKSL